MREEAKEEEGARGGWGEEEEEGKRKGWIRGQEGEGGKDGDEAD